MSSPNKETNQEAVQDRELKNRVLIVGDGFAGLAAARKLAGTGMEVTVIGRGKAVFLPMLPDLVSGRVREETLAYAYYEELTGRGIHCIAGELVSLDIKEKVAHIRSESDEGNASDALFWDYLLLATGGEPAFQPEGALVFAGLAGARKAASLQEERVTVLGGGYTGVEVAAALVMKGTHKKVVIVEAAPQILSGLPARVRRRVKKALEVSGAEIFCGEKLEIRDNHFFFRDEELSPASVIIAAGIKGSAGYWPETMDNLLAEKSGRIMVNEFLQAENGVYAAGDIAGFQANGAFLRPSVNFALGQGRQAARNILREWQGKKVRPYRVRDPGYVVPVYSRARAWGIAFGLPIGGRFGLLAHYMVSIYKAFANSQRWHMLRDLLRRRKRQKKS